MRGLFLGQNKVVFVLGQHSRFSYALIHLGSKSIINAFLTSTSSSTSRKELSSLTSCLIPLKRAT